MLLQREASACMGSAGKPKCGEMSLMLSIVATGIEGFSSLRD
jgi:hypothetical protein